MACAIHPDFFYIWVYFKIFPRTATNPHEQYFLDWESRVGVLFKGTYCAQLVCQILTSSIFGFCANCPFGRFLCVVVPVECGSL